MKVINNKYLFEAIFDIDDFDVFGDSLHTMSDEERSILSFQNNEAFRERLEKIIKPDINSINADYGFDEYNEEQYQCVDLDKFYNICTVNENCELIFNIRRGRYNFLYFFFYLEEDGRFKYWSDLIDLYNCYNTWKILIDPSYSQCIRPFKIDYNNEILRNKKFINFTFRFLETLYSQKPNGYAELKCTVDKFYDSIDIFKTYIKNFLTIKSNKEFLAFSFDAMRAQSASHTMSFEYFFSEKFIDINSIYNLMCGNATIKEFYIHLDNGFNVKKIFLESKYWSEDFKQIYKESPTKNEDFIDLGPILINDFFKTSKIKHIYVNKNFVNPANASLTYFEYVFIFKNDKILSIGSQSFICSENENITYSIFNKHKKLL